MRRIEDHAGGLEAMRRVVARFYDKVYAHPSFAPLFEKVPRARQEARLLAFTRMAEGPRLSGDEAYLRQAHAHLPLTKELFAIRHGLLREAIAEEGLPAEAARAWLAFDRRFEAVLGLEGR